MYDMIKVVIGFGAFLLVLAIPEWLSEHAPWVAWIIAAVMLAYAIVWLQKRYNEALEEETRKKQAESELINRNCRCTMHPIDIHSRNAEK